MAQLINLRAINFGCAFNSWNPNEAFYGRSDEKEICNSFVQKRVDNPLFVPDQNDQMTIIRMKFYKLLRKETFLPIDAIEEHWNDDDEFSCETRNSLKGQGIVDFLLQSTLFALLDDLMCTSEDLPEAYKETEESLEQSMVFMIEGFLQNVNESEDKNDSKEINENNGKFEHDTDEDEVEEDIDYSESAEMSDVESSVCDESSDSEYCQSEVDDDQIEVKSIDMDKSPDDKKDIQNDCPVASANNEDLSCTPKSPVQNGECSEQYSTESDETLVCTDEKSNDVIIPEKIMLEQSVQTDDDEENSAKNVIENLKKKIDLFNENLYEKNEKIDALKVELSKISSLNQKLEIENGKLLDQKEKLSKKLTNQATLFQKKEAELTKEMDLTEKSCLEKLALLQNYVETLLMNCKEKCSVYEQNQSKLEQAVVMLEKENAMLKLRQSESSVTRTLNNNYSTNKIELEEASRSESDENVEDDVEEHVEEDVAEDFEEDVEEDVPEDFEEDIEENVEEDFEESAQVYVDDSVYSNHLMNGLSSSESTQDEVAQSEAFVLSNYVEPQDEGNWETSSRHSSHSKSDVGSSTTSIVRKKKFNLLRDSLVKLNPVWTESEVEECMRIVRVRNNNSLTGLPMTEISARVRILLDERSRKPSTLGLEKFTKVGWCQSKPTDNSWSGNIELEDCIICSEEIDRKHLTTLECHHYFHTECIRKWLKEKSICPLCTTFTKMPDEFPAL
ncbi:DNA ligase 1 isoform X2 [Nilaparvata lugens]|uniref:DNA ligase 1 isoform X2 n=1 Tax=Nilaparvata lugens TaxID=108931 RepID=UPI00193E50DE|nr:DNA ligase 1 isoform X2 [Nilaparvata lugens]